MSSFNEKMRQRPKAVRTMYAFWSAVAVTSVLALVWLAFIPSKMETLSNAANPASLDPEGNFMRVIKSMRAAVGDTFDGVKSELETIQDAQNLASSTSIAASSTDPNIIDFSTFFNENGASGTTTEYYDEEMYIYDEEITSSGSTTNSNSVSTTTPSAPQPRVILIGTSTRATGTATQ